MVRIAAACPAPRPRWHKVFVAMLPQIVRYAKIAFRSYTPEAKQEAVQNVVTNTRNSPVPDIVAFRCDFADWLKSLKRRDRRIAEYLSLGHRTSAAARRFKVSQGRVSQLRRELAQSWSKFTGENEGNAA